MSWKTHGKSIVAGLGALLMAAVVTYQEVSNDHNVTMSEWVVVVIAVFGVASVWAAANISGFDKAKTVVAALFVGLNLLVGFLTDGRLSNDEIGLMVIQVLAALGVAGAPAPKQIVERTVIAK